MTVQRMTLAVLVALAVLAGKPARAADAALIEAAKKEGKVVWYTTLIVNQAIRPLKEAFEKAYPGIELQYTRADEAPTAAKILAEAQAGRVQADIFDGISNMVPLKRAGLVVPHGSPSAGKIPADLKDREGYWISILIYVFSPGINTTLVSNLKALSAQRIVNIEASSRAILDQVIAGEYPMGLMMFNHHTVISAQKGAPSDWIKLEPVPVALDAVAILKDAPHGNAAKLLVDFLTSEDGQRVLQKADYLPAMPSVPAMKTGLRPEDGGFQATFLKPDEIHDRIPGWIKIVGELFR
jgi:ABC-type Fe3+ transport system substrate-binding protein